MSSVVDRFEILMSVRRFPDAEVCARDMIAQYPDWGPSYTHLARALIELKRYDEALPAAREGVHKSPHDSWAHAIVALVHERLKQHQDAIEAAHEALRVQPTYSFAFCLLSYNYVALEKLTKALQATTDGLKHQPHDQELLRFHAWNLYRLDRFDEAASMARETLRLYPTSHESFNVLAQIAAVRARRHFIRGRLALYQEAHRYFLDALRLRPGLDHIQKNMRDNAIAFRRWFWPWFVFVPYVVFVSLAGGLIGEMAFGSKFGISFALSTFMIGTALNFVDAPGEKGEDYYLELPLDRWGLPSAPLNMEAKPMSWHGYFHNWKLLAAIPPILGMVFAMWIQRLK